MDKRHPITDCPICGSENVEEKSLQYEDEVLFRNFYCDNCGAELQEIYLFQHWHKVLNGYVPYNTSFFETNELLTNPFVQDAPIDGYMFETYGKERKFVDWIYKVYPENVRTIIEEDGYWYIAPGMQFVNRIGYLILMPDSHDSV